MLNVTVNIDRASLGLERMPAQVADAVAAKVRALTLNLEAHVVGDKLQGQVLAHRSGALSQSIHNVVTRNGGTTTGEVFSDGSVKYAAIHEFGGKTSPHDILPQKAQALAFMIGGRQVFAKIVHHPGSNIPERSFMRSSLADMADDIVAGIRAAAITSAQKAMATR